MPQATVPEAYKEPIRVRKKRANRRRRAKTEFANRSVQTRFEARSSPYRSCHNLRNFGPSPKFRRRGFSATQIH